MRRTHEHRRRLVAVAAAALTAVAAAFGPGGRLLAQNAGAVSEAAAVLQRLQDAALGKRTAPDPSAGSAASRQGAAELLPPINPEPRPRVNPLLAPAEIKPRDAVVVPFSKSTTPENIELRDDAGLISLVVRGGSLRQVVSLIAQTQNQNIVFAGSADAVVTATFERVPWQQVLNALLAASGHASTRSGNIIFVSPVDAASFIPPGADGRQVQVFQLDFASAVDVDQSVQGLLSAAGQSWVMEINAADNRRTREAVTVVDYPRYLARISDFICQADQPPRQVMIEAHILEVELNDECRSGVNFEALASLSSSSLSFKTIGMANAAASPSFFIEATGGDLTTLVELVKNTTDAKILASPRIHAVNGQEANIQIGEKIGYNEAITSPSGGPIQNNVKFLDVGVVLNVTPRITRDGRVLMTIKPEVSKGAVNPVTLLPNTKTTNIETNVMLASGQGMVIGGLIQEEDSNVQSKIPVLGSIPYVGVLFERRTVKKTRKEIIVTLVPYVLPYHPAMQARNDAEVQRTLDPLTAGAIYSAPRPYEPKMVDPLTNPPHVALFPKHQVPEHLEDGAAPTEFVDEPVVGEAAAACEVDGAAVPVPAAAAGTDDDAGDAGPALGPAVLPPPGF